jgi:hypothetical protein
MDGEGQASQAEAHQLVKPRLSYLSNNIVNVRWRFFRGLASSRHDRKHPSRQLGSDQLLRRSFRAGSRAARTQVGRRSDCP